MGMGIVWCCRYEQHHPFDANNPEEDCLAFSQRLIGWLALPATAAEIKSAAEQDGLCPCPFLILFPPHPFLPDPVQRLCLVDLPGPSLQIPPILLFLLPLPLLPLPLLPLPLPLLLLLLLELSLLL